MGYLNLNSGTIQNFSVSQVAESSDLIVVHVTIDTDLGTTKYRICEDTRATIKDIINDFNNGLNTAKSSDADFYINEYQERDYIFVTFPNGETKQYTAKRI
ncbi:MAG TPA: hypothetical protein PK385_04350 [Spirochaetota bacterium]|jgi:hypothetical protein|nr:MAG: hypothetical protein BWX91_01382 [Spirochaetes bacterium ADurb.Bin133]HNZ28075.1 hypothetical protein [Spirochaetota bacterium]HOF00888.1 hypothetical protein [Spirochaetota bacterium]HOS32763.1 hypothetical protein [Spirochaetota bacterium]HOS55270.1 hypothetical protein [Spirochaetota bacterium]